MFIYNVTVHVEPTVETEWLNWMREEHIPAVLNTGKFTLAKLFKVITDQDRIRPIDADLQVPNTKKFSDHTGWYPKISFDKTMEDLLNYWRLKIKTGEKFLSR